MVKHKSIYEFLKILKYKIDLNRFKFQYKLLYRLGIYLKKFYKKRIGFNIVNLRSKNLNIDILEGSFRKLPSMWVKLSNSGDSLILWVPNKSLIVIICGWINFSGKVITLMIKEIEIGNRGSKSITILIKNVVVKEPRVYGSWHHSFFGMCLRCTLNNLKINCQVNILSNKINTYKFFTTLIVNGDSHKNNTFLAPIRTQKINPWFITGFSVGESCFHVFIAKNEKSKVGYIIQLIFSITLHKKDKALLEEIQNFFNVGMIYKHGSHSIQFIVRSVKDLAVIINHFDKFPLLSQKKADFLLWKEVFYLMLNKEHMTQEGLHKIVAIRASMNMGLSSELQTAFLNLIPASRPKVANKTIQDPNWLSGFTTAEGCFFINIGKATTKVGFAVSLIFHITQHSRDKQLIKNLIEYLECGFIIIRSRQKAVDLKVTKFSDIYNKIIPFFKKHPIKGAKSEDFKDFCLVADMMKEKKHLTTEGLNQIKLIKAGMNKGRKFS